MNAKITIKTENAVRLYFYSECEYEYFDGGARANFTLKNHHGETAVSLGFNRDKLTLFSVTTSEDVLEMPEKKFFTVTAGRKNRDTVIALDNLDLVVGNEYLVVNFDPKGASAEARCYFAGDGAKSDKHILYIECSVCE